MALSTVERWTGQQQETFSENDTSLGYWSEPMPTIEDLRQHLNSCLSCGVNWQDDHVSLDCAECGGYSLSRPCPVCDGKCGQQWKRDMAASHTLAKAKWTGNCALLSKPKQTDLLGWRFFQMRSTS